MTTSDIPKGWKLEAVAPPEVYLRGPSEDYRKNYDRIFKKEEIVEDTDCD